jgi:PiT family inorganic phosphate transporter
MFDFFKSAIDNLGTSHFWDLSLIVWALILLALTFDFLNGLHDAANSIATVVSTRVLTPLQAVIWAAFFNFAAFIIFPLHVAGTIAKDVIDQDVVRSLHANHLIAGTLLAACGWNVFTWVLGLPTSSSHALIGGMVGASVAIKGDFSSVNVEGLSLIVAFIFLAPLFGMVLATLIGVGVFWAFRRASPQGVDKLFRRGQLFSAALFSLGHGGNDAQKTMGIIMVLLIGASASGGFAAPKEVPTEVVLACHVAMGVGTLFGGWRIVKTMGQRIARLRPVDGFCAETGAALTLAFTTIVRGIPISTTHTITGAIVGIGSLRRARAVRWATAGQVVWAWILTIPGAGLLAFLSAELLLWLMP